MQLATYTHSDEKTNIKVRYQDRHESYAHGMKGSLADFIKVFDPFQPDNYSVKQSHRVKGMADDIEASYYYDLADC